MNNLTLHLLDESDPAQLLCHYTGQINPQPVFVEIDQGGHVSVAYNGEIGNAVPRDVWHRRTLRYTLPGIPTAADANWLISDDNSPIRPLIERIAAGLGEEWDGSNWIGTLTEDAARADDELCTLINNDYYYGLSLDWLSSINADDLYGQCYPDEIGITAETTDEQIEEIASRDRAMALADNTVVFGVVDYLTELRDVLYDELCEIDDEE